MLIWFLLARLQRLDISINEQWRQVYFEYLLITWSLGTVKLSAHTFVYIHDHFSLYTDWHITPIFYMSWLYCHQVVVLYFVKHIVFCCVRLSFFSSIISAFSRVYKISLSYKGVLLKIFVWCTSLVWHGNTLECTWNAHCMSCKSWMSCWEVTKIWESHFFALHFVAEYCGNWQIRMSKILRILNIIKVLT